MSGVPNLALALAIAVMLVGCAPNPIPEHLPKMVADQDQLPADAPKNKSTADRKVRRVSLAKTDLPGEWTTFNMLDDSSLGYICAVDPVPLKPVAIYSSKWIQVPEKKTSSVFIQTMFPVGYTQATRTIEKLRAAVKDCRSDIYKTQVKEFEVADQEAFGVAMKYEKQNYWRCRVFFVSGDFLMVFTVFSYTDHPRNDLLDTAISAARAKANASVGEK